MTRPGSSDSAVGEASEPSMVLGYDRSASSRHAASWVANQLPAGGKLVIVYACRPQHLPPVPLSTQGERHDLGRAILDELLLDGEEALLDIDLETEVSDDDPVSALIDAARRNDARAIVLGAKHHSRLHEALGTVTTELLKTSPVPVITVPLSAASKSAGRLEAGGSRGSRNTSPATSSPASTSSPVASFSRL